MIEGPAVDGLGREGGALVLGMAGLPADAAPVLALRRRRLGRLDDVGRGGLGGGGGILPGRGELLAELGDDVLEGGEFRLQGILSRLEATTIRAVGRVLGSPGATLYKLCIRGTTTVNAHWRRFEASESHFGFLPPPSLYVECSPD
jgi:hypothetical protein